MAEAAVVGVPAGDVGELATAWVVLKEPCSRAQLLQHVDSTLSSSFRAAGKYANNDVKEREETVNEGNSVSSHGSVRRNVFPSFVRSFLNVCVKNLTDTPLLLWC